MVSATTESRDHIVDAARALSIVVVTLWRWTLSVTHRIADGTLAMPNPINAVPGAWLASWFFQVMPLFFLVGGYANLAGWAAVWLTGETWVGADALKRESELQESLIGKPNQIAAVVAGISGEPTVFVDPA